MPLPIVGSRHVAQAKYKCAAFNHVVIDRSRGIDDEGKRQLVDRMSRIQHRSEGRPWQPNSLLHWLAKPFWHVTHLRAVVAVLPPLGLEQSKLKQRPERATKKQQSSSLTLFGSGTGASIAVVDPNNTETHLRALVWVSLSTGFGVMH